MGKILKEGAPRRFLAAVAAMLVAIAALAVPALAEGYSDTGEHWGAAVIEKWSDYGVLRGDGDGAFAPDRDMSVAELAAVLGRTFGYSQAGNPRISPEIPAWAVEDVRKAVTAGAIKANETGLELTRELAAKIIANAFQIAPEPGAANFADAASISAAYRPYARALGALGVFNGDTGHNFMPQKGFTRAEVMQVLDNAVADIVTESRPAASDKALIVGKPGVALTAGTAKGDVIIAQGVGNGDVTLEDVEIGGRLIILGGGRNSVHIRGKSVIPNVLASKTFGNPVRVVVEGAGASVGTVAVVAGGKAIVETEDGAKIGKIEVMPKAEVSAAGEIEAAPVNAATELTVGAEAGEIDIGAPDVKITLEATAQIETIVSGPLAANAEITAASGATVEKLDVGGENTSVSISSGAEIGEATISAGGVTVSGAGKLGSAIVTEGSDGDVSIAVAGAKVENESGAAVSTGDGKTVSAGQTGTVTAPAAGGSGTGSSGSTDSTGSTGGSGGGGGDSGGGGVVYYVVAFEPNGAGAIAPQSVAYGGRAARPADPAMAGHVFGGWYADSAFAGEEYDFDAAVLGNVTLYAKWTPVQYTVSFEPNGGSGVAPQSVAEGGRAARPADPAMPGFAFAGWYEDSGLAGEPYDFDAPVGRDFTLYARWEIAQYTVTFETNGGSAVEPRGVAHGGIVGRPDDPTMEGYAFDGWYEDIGLAGAEYDFGAEVTGDITLYAKWATAQYTVAFEPNGADAIAAQTVEHGYSAARPADPAKTGHIFEGWYEDSGFAGAEYNFGAAVFGDVTLYAKWTPVQYTVAFVTNGADAIAPQSVAYGSKAARPADPAKEGHSFDGWYADIGLAGAAYDFDAEVTGDVTLHAKWTPDALSIVAQQIGYDAQYMADMLVLEFSAAISTVVNNELIEWDIDGGSADILDGDGATVAKLILSMEDKIATIEPASPGKTAIPALTFTAAASGETTASAAVELYKADGKAERNDGTIALNGIVKVLFADETRPLAQIKYSDDSTAWVHFDDTVADGAHILGILRAVYLPNAPGSTDAIESGKTTIAYTEAISEAALNLFEIYIDSTHAANDSINIKGTELPAADGESTTNLIVIDVGIPGGANNGALPTFHIPYGALGASDDSYGAIRFRVNSGASLVIEADNDSYIANGANHPCPPGNFNNGCIEAMPGGKLRDGAYEGFPLGSNAVLLSRLGSYLAVGPESSFEIGGAGYVESRDKWYSGWLVGPAEGNPRIVWDSGDQTGGYIEVRPGQLAISANVTVKKTLGLIYSVWFVNGPTVTIDAAGDTVDIEGMKGLFANGDNYKFYGTEESSGGQNPGSPAATIIVKPGSTLHQMFLTAGNTHEFGFITASSDDRTIVNKGDGDSVLSGTYVGGITGYLNWEEATGP
ncbi:MAG: InlB B-repeat-containing protein [Clostridiales bacterium]|jgi:uncharacterized repeat protein (TIGR02543 family)|nr:InlB B-repeat-containing protein [Clostridiales bacterium]